MTDDIHILIVYSRVGFALCAIKGHIIVVKEYQTTISNCY